MGLVLTADAVCFDPDGALLLVRRRKDPFGGFWALPGGKVELGETVEAACLRELFEETGLGGQICALVGLYSNLERDPRGQWISAAYLVTANEGECGCNSEVSAVEWVTDWQNKVLAFDHNLIARDALKIEPGRALEEEVPE